MAIESKIDNGDISITSSCDTWNRPAVLTDGESRAVKVVETALAEIGVQASEICYRRRSKDYLSLVVLNEYDFLRIKIGERATWFSVFLSGELQRELLNDPRFARQKNKRQMHWKVQLNSLHDLEADKDLIQYGYKSALWSHEMALSQKK